MSMPHSQPTLGFLLHDVARFLRKRFEQNARGLGLTRSQWQVLAFLAPNEGIHQGGLAEILEVEPITLLRILDKLESRGLIERRQHPTDRRIWLLYLTPQAHPILDQMRELGDLTRSEALDGIPEAEREKLLGTLTIMKKNLVAACAKPAATREATHG
jgi:DNA-binding MarR family transcriptional regulator